MTRCWKSAAATCRVASALDYESERIVQENMGAIARQRTVIIIAHRLSTVRHCDQINVLDGGTIVEQGSHDDLLALNGYYARLHSYQACSPPIRPVKASGEAVPDAVTGRRNSGGRTDGR